MKKIIIISVSVKYVHLGQRKFFESVSVSGPVLGRGPSQNWARSEARLWPRGGPDKFCYLGCHMISADYHMTRAYLQFAP